MFMISYAQNHEDVLLDRMFPRGTKGFYIDVGANDPVVHSVSKHFYDLGWHGVNVEPSPLPFERLVRERTRDINLNVGLSAQSGELTFYDFPEEFCGFSTFSQEQAARHSGAGAPSTVRQVRTTTLQEVCEEHVTGPIDFLSIDVEGHEQQVIRGGDWRRWRPRVVLVEATQPNTTIPTHEPWEPVLLEADYLFAAFDGLNRYYVCAEDSALRSALAVPVNVTDAYVPYELWKQSQELRWALRDATGQLAAARLANQTLAAQFQEFAPELVRLRAQYEKLGRALTNARSRCEAVRQQTQAVADRMEEEIAAAHRRIEATEHLLQGLGPTGLAAARRLMEMSRRFPRVASPVKRGLLAGLRVERAAHRTRD